MAARKKPVPRVRPDEVHVGQLPCWADPHDSMSNRIESLLLSASFHVPALRIRNVGDQAKRDREMATKFLYAAIGERVAISKLKLEFYPRLFAELNTGTSPRALAWDSAERLIGAMRPDPYAGLSSSGWPGGGRQKFTPVRPASHHQQVAGLRKLIDEWLADEEKTAPPEDVQRVIPGDVMTKRAKEARGRLARLYERRTELADLIARTEKTVAAYEKQGF